MVSARLFFANRILAFEMLMVFTLALVRIRAVAQVAEPRTRALACDAFVELETLGTGESSKTCLTRARLLEGTRGDSVINHFF